MRFDDVINFFGTQKAAAKKLKVKQPAVSNWKKRGRVPSLQQLKIQRITRGQLRADRQSQRLLGR